MEKEDKTRLLKLSKDKSLIIKFCSHTTNYYGVKQNKMDDVISVKVKELEIILKKVIPSLTSFCNFTEDRRIRYLCNYDYPSPGGFIGISYTSIKEITKET